MDSIPHDLLARIIGLSEEARNCRLVSKSWSALANLNIRHLLKPSLPALLLFPNLETIRVEVEALADVRDFLPQATKLVRMQRITVITRLLQTTTRQLVEFTKHFGAFHHHGILEWSHGQLIIWNGKPLVLQAEASDGCEVPQPLLPAYHIVLNGDLHRQSLVVPSGVQSLYLQSNEPAQVLVHSQTLRECVYDNVQFTSFMTATKRLQKFVCRTPVNHCQTIVSLLARYAPNLNTIFLEHHQLPDVEDNDGFLSLWIACQDDGVVLDPWGVVGWRASICGDSECNVSIKIVREE